MKKLNIRAGYINSGIENAEAKPIEVAPKNGSTFTLEELQNYVGGYIEIITCENPNYLIVMNEEGKLLGLRKNYFATEFAGSGIFAGDYIAGCVIICERGMID